MPINWLVVDYRIYLVHFRPCIKSMCRKGVNDCISLILKTFLRFFSSERVNDYCTNRPIVSLCQYITLADRQTNTLLVLPTCDFLWFMGYRSNHNEVHCNVFPLPLLINFKENLSVDLRVWQQHSHFIVKLLLRTWNRIIYNGVYIERGTYSGSRV